jgi:hydroxymethylpyrimidine pyrophosphatase-like HAD family hydrolase
MQTWAFSGYLKRIVRGDVVYKMIAVDMDGTLLNDEHKLTAENTEAIQKVQELGVKVVPFTGRAFYTMDDIAGQLKLCDAAATQNGSTVVNPLDGSVLFSNLISPEICKSIFTASQEQGFFPLVYQGDKVYSKLQGKYLDIFEKCMDMKVDYIDDAFDIYNEEPLGKILIMDDPARISRFYNWLVDAYGDRIFICSLFHHPGYVGTAYAAGFYLYNYIIIFLKLRYIHFHAPHIANSK